MKLLIMRSSSFCYSLSDISLLSTCSRNYFFQRAHRVGVAYIVIRQKGVQRYELFNIPSHFHYGHVQVRYFNR
jgi:hypothetical protein